MSNKVFIYNMHQADFYIKEGCTVIGSGFGNKKDAYILFLYNETYLEAKNMWMKK